MKAKSVTEYMESEMKRSPALRRRVAREKAKIIRVQDKCKGCGHHIKHHDNAMWNCLKCDCGIYKF